LSDATSDRKRRGGSAVPIVILLLLVLAGGLGWNYHRNARIDQQTEQKSRPYAAMSTPDLSVMIEGYRQELAAASASAGRTRVATRERYHFGEQIKEFERVQHETRRIRDRQIEAAQIQAELDRLEAEQKIRGDTSSKAMVHLTRMFRI